MFLQGWVKSFAIFWYMLACDAYITWWDSTHCGWQYHGSYCTDSLCIASLVWFESCTDEYAIFRNLCFTNLNRAIKREGHQKNLFCEKWRYRWSLDHNQMVQEILLILEVWVGLKRWTPNPSSNPSRQI